jgi:hypothetical protein
VHPIACPPIRGSPVDLCTPKERILRVRSRYLRTDGTAWNRPARPARLVPHSSGERSARTQNERAGRELLSNEPSELGGGSRGTRAADFVPAVAPSTAQSGTDKSRRRVIDSQGSTTQLPEACYRESMPSSPNWGASPFATFSRPPALGAHWQDRARRGLRVDCVTPSVAPAPKASFRAVGRTGLEPVTDGL